MSRWLINVLLITGIRPFCQLYEPLPVDYLHSIAGAYGFLTFGKEVEADILMSYNGGDVLMLIARLLFGISIITIYPIIVLLGR